MALNLNTRFSKGMEALNQGDFQAAQGHLKAVIRLAPASPEANSCLGFVEANLGNLEAALDYTGKALKAAPENPQVRTHRAFALIASGREDEGASELIEANKLAPGQTAILNQLSKLYEKAGKFSEAEPLLEELFRLSPRDPAIANRYISALLEQEKGELALKAARSLKNKFPDNEFVWGQIAKAARKAGAWLLAREYFEKLVRQDGKDISYKRGLGHSLMELNRYEEVIPVLTEIYRLEPTSRKVLYSLGYAFFSLHMYEQSMPFIEQTLEFDPDHVNALLIKGRTLVYYAELDQAREFFERVLELDPTHPMAHMQLNKMSPPTEKNQTFEVLENLYAGITEGDPHQGLLGFALGDMYDAIKDYDQAFHYYSLGNQRARAAYAKIGAVFDETETGSEFGRLKTLFSKQNLARINCPGSSSTRPIFIVAMPRAGTTLLEQIISSHSMVFGAGELPHAGTMANRLKEDLAKDTFEQLEKTLAAHGEGYARGYLEALPGAKAGKKHVTDKMPTNFLHLGLLQLVLPKASYIHIRRNPLDTCMSMFRGFFNKGYPYACDLYTLGLYYRQYDVLMKHWARALPRPMLEITYEELVTDSETLAPKILEFCGLEWQPECLEYYKNKHKVITMSTYQVRKPITTSALGKWRRYEKYIEPLLDGLGDEITSTLKL
ncbi:MAG: sulfotransferase [Proteobacteria bacterium]|nr:sulfotransferase [Pseudomonadota bacterium]